VLDPAEGVVPAGRGGNAHVDLPSLLC
jgi:hypothetical protein